MGSAFIFFSSSRPALADLSLLSTLVRAAPRLQESPSQPSVLYPVTEYKPQSMTAGEDGCGKATHDPACSSHWPLLLERDFSILD